MDESTVLAELQRRQKAGFHVDSRLLSEVQKPGELFLLTLHKEEDYLNLVWQSIDDTRPLTPIGSPRTLRDCVGRLEGYGWSFANLCDAGYPWFEKCTDIDGDFDLEKFGWIALVPMNVHEQNETPSGTYYIYDGVHKALVFAKKVIRAEAEYRPLQALLLTPRR